jgi:hypothetical protein
MKLLTLIYCALAPVVAMAQTGAAFPPITGMTLEDKEITIPTDTQNKITIVGMAYSKKSEDILRGWYEPMFNKFVLKRGIMDHLYDVNFFFIPMYTGGKKLAYDASIKQMKESNRKDLFPYLLFYKGELSPYTEVLKMEEKELPYLFIIDENGKIIYHTKGLFSEKKMEEIEAVLDARM